MTKSLMKTFSCLPLVLACYAAAAQGTYSFIPTFSWKNIEKKNPSVIEKFIELTPSEDFDYYQESDELAKVLHTVDLNNDKLDDVIFEGQVSEEEDAVIIYMNKGTSFKKEFSKDQHILHIKFDKGVLSAIAIEDEGCCGEVITRDQFYEVKPKSNGDLHFKLLESFEYLQETELPETYWPATKDVRVQHDKYKVRSAPVIDDSTSHADDEGVGNVIGLLPQYAEAMAMAEATDATGRVWYFVAVYPGYPLTNTPFYEPKDGLISYKCGWISSRFVEVVKNK